MAEDKTESVEQKPKKKRGRPKGSKNKKSTDPADVLEKLAEMLGKVSKRLDNVEAGVLSDPNAITARGPNAPTMHQRANAELMPQIPGPAPQRQTDAEVNKERRAGIYAEREKRGRVDRQEMPSGVMSSVGNRQSRDHGKTSITNRAQ